MVPRNQQLRDALLTPLGVTSTIERGAESLPGEPASASAAANASADTSDKVTAADTNKKGTGGKGPILLVVSPLTRTVLTAALLFRKLEEEGREVTSNGAPQFSLYFVPAKTHTFLHAHLCSIIALQPLTSNPVQSGTRASCARGDQRAARHC